MSERPLILFPSPELVKRSKLNGRVPPFNKPSISRQEERLSPQLRFLQEAFTARRVEVQQTTAGIDPEMALVIETVGSIESFANAVKRIEGLEWLAEIEEDKITPDEDFYYAENPDKDLPGRLYLVMTNQQALNQMLSLWIRYKADPAIKFGYGLEKFKKLFRYLKEIRFWDVRDRLEETGILKDWQDKLKGDGDCMVRFQTELWYRGSSEKRQLSEDIVSDHVHRLGGNIINRCIIPEIAYHSLLVELPASSIQEIVDNSNTQLVECDGIMFFRPVGQMSVGKRSAEIEQLNPTDINAEELPVSISDPIIALLDGLPLENHILLSNRLTIDDPDDWSINYSSKYRIHGTAMASLILHGDLNNGIQPLSRRLYVRPILKPNLADPDPGYEQIEENEELAIDFIHHAVRRIVGNDGGEDAVAPTVKIINLSIGDPSRQFYQTMSPFARLIDWLSFHYNVLFIVSAGNHFEPINTGLGSIEFNQLPPLERERVVVNSVYNEFRNRKIISPAESINALTIGSSHYDTAVITPQYPRLDPFNCMLPSPYSSFGNGYRKAVKPDLLYPGGRQLYEICPICGGIVSLESASIGAPGVKVASPGRLTGDLNNIIWDRGTSVSTALTSRGAAICYDLLIELFGDQRPEVDYQPYIVPLLKAMVVHGCSWGEAGIRLKSILGEFGNRHQVRNRITQWLGYGASDFSKVRDCSDQRVTLLGFGQLKGEEAGVFHLPLPPSLGSCHEKRRLTVTLAWLSPIAPSTQKYRVASLWFDVNTNILGLTRKDADVKAVQRGTVQHEVFEGEQALPLIDGDTLEIKVNCREDAGKIETPIAYGLVVSLEVAEGVDIPIYDEIRTRIAPTVMIRSEGNT